MLKTYISEGLELVIDELSGEVFASQSAMARMSKVGESTVRKFLTSHQLTGKKAETLTSTGLKTSHIHNLKTIVKVVNKYNPELAEQFMELGATLVLQRAVNYEMSSHSVMAEVDKVVDKLYNRADHRKVHNAFDAWCIKYKFERSRAAKAVVEAVTGQKYNDFMEGHNYGKEWSVDVASPACVDAITRLKDALVSCHRMNNQPLKEVIARAQRKLMQLS